MNTPEDNNLQKNKKTFNTIQTNLETGLNDDQVKKSLLLNGANILKKQKNKPFIVKFFLQFLDPMILLLVIATLISVALLISNSINPDLTHSFDPTINNILKVIEYVEPCIIAIIVLVNAFFGAFQEQKAEKALEALEKITSPICKVIRNGIFQKIASDKIVVGDLLILDAGDSIVADGKVIEESSLKCVESILTGESNPVEKDASFISNSKTPIGDRKDYVFAGTSVVNGRGKILVTKIGMKTEIGKIAKLIQENTSTLSPLQKKLGKLSRFLGIFAIVVCIISFIIYVTYVNLPSHISSSWDGGLKISISLAIAAIPEGLMAITTVVLAFGIKRMIKHNALIKKLPAVEALGSASVICSDKTGTLTQNKMTVVKLFFKDKFETNFNLDSSKEIMKYSILCNDTKIDNNDFIGDPTETSMYAFAKKNNFDIDKLLKELPRVEELPFDSDRKMMTTIHKIKNDEYLVVTKGAFDQILKNCKVSPIERKKIDEANLQMGEHALRVIAFAIKKIKALPSQKDLLNIESDLDFKGLLGIIDPPREEAKLAIKQCIDAGIRTIMITGDHVNTATAIAKQLGILSGDQKSISGAEFEKMSDAEFEKNVEQYSVYARVSPLDKIRIVKAWQAKNKVVAMTGDGVNDAPALQAADIGCAMGITGTEVAKGAADMILTDDNFATIVEAVKEGRGILDNIKRLVLTLLTICFSELINILFGMLIFKFSPFTTLQILWINLLGESFPGIALGLKKPEKNIMQFKPSNLNQPILTKKLIIKVFVQSFFLGGLALFAFYLGAGAFVGFDYNKIVYVLSSYSNLTASTELNLFAFNMQMAGSGLTFIFFSLAQIINPLNLFSKNSIFKTPFKDLKPLLIAICISSSLTFFVSFVPYLNDVFNADVWIFSYSSYNIANVSSLTSMQIVNDPILGSILDFSYISNYQYLLAIVIFMAFVPTIVFELLKAINNSKKFKNYVQSNKNLNRLFLN